MKRFDLSLLVVVLFGASFLAVPTPAEADVVSVAWDDADGWWNTAANWDPAVVPNNNGDQYEVSIDQADAKVRLDISPTVNSLTNHNEVYLYNKTLRVTGELTNYGTIYGNDGTGTIRANVTNSGTLEADGGRLRITDSTIGGGILRVTDDGNSIVQFSGDIRLSGVTWEDPGAGEFQIPASTTARFLEEELVPAGQTLRVKSNAQLALPDGASTNNGTIDLHQYQSTLHAESDVTLGGSGEVWLNYSSARVTVEPGAWLTVGPELMIHGRGQIEANLVNNGLIRADVAGQVLRISDATVNNTDGTLAADGGILEIAGSTITGGILETAKGGAIRAVQGDPNTLQNVTNLGDFQMKSGSTTIVSGSTLSNDGTMVVNYNHGGQTSLQFEGDVTLSGSGSLHLDKAGSDAQLNIADGHTLTHGAAHTIRGEGQINGGAIDNLGTLEATGGTLTVTAEVAQFDGATLTGGTWIARADSNLDITTGSDIATNQGTVILDGPGSVLNRIDALADNQGAFSILKGRDFATVGDLTNSGTLTVGPGSILTVNGNLQMEDGSEYVSGLGSTGLIAATGNIQLDDGSTLNLVGFDPLPTWGQQTLRIMEVAEPAQYGISGEFDHELEVGTSAENEGTYLLSGIWFGNYQTGEGLIYVDRAGPWDPEAPDPASAIDVTVWQAKCGDTDGDRDVDFADFNSLANNYTGSLDPGTGGKDWAEGDFDGDGDVDFEDFNSLANCYTGSGTQYASAKVGSHTAPEPGSLVLLAGGALGLLFLWQRRRAA